LIPVVAVITADGFMNLYLSDLAMAALFTPASMILLLVLSGWGKLLHSSGSTGEPVGGEWTRDLWIGWISCTVFLQLWHLAWPVDWKTAVIVGVIGLTGWWRSKPSVTALFSGEYLRTLVIVAPVCFAILAIVMRHARSDITVYDTGMYYYQAIRWLNEFAVIAGLGNLNLQLGFNQIYFLWAALLNLHPLWRSGFIILNAALLTAAILPALLTFIRLRKQSVDSMHLPLIRTLSLPVYILLAMNFNSGNPSPDFLSWVLCIIVFDRSVAWLMEVNDHGSNGNIELPVLPLWLCVSLVMVKLSMLVFSVTLFAILIVVYFIRVHRISFMRIVIMACAGLSLGIPWLARTVIQTGYPLFPATVVAMDVDWKVPEYKARMTTAYIKAWSRNPGDDKRDYRKRLQFEAVSLLVSDPKVSTEIQIEALIRPSPWFRGWIKEMWDIGFIRIFVMAESIMLFLLVVLAVRGSTHKRDSNRTLLLLLYIPPTVSLGFWLCGVPALRFGLAFMYLLLLITAVDVMEQLKINHSSLIKVTQMITVILAVVAIYEGFPPRSGDWKNMMFPRPIPVEMMQEQTKSGLNVLLPDTGAKSFDAALPSTTILNPYLVLREPDAGLSGGFRDETPEHLRYSGF